MYSQNSLTDELPPRRRRRVHKALKYSRMPKVKLEGKIQRRTLRTASRERSDKKSKEAMRSVRREILTSSDPEELKLYRSRLLHRPSPSLRMVESLRSRKKKPLRRPMPGPVSK